MYIPRELQRLFDKVRGVTPVLALVGARQAGKTTFLKEQSRSGSYAYLLFDDPDVRGLFEQDIKQFERVYVEGKDVVVLDEVQLCKGAGEKLKYLADSGHS